MATTPALSSWLLFSMAFALLVRHSASLNDRKVYIVYMGERQREEEATSSLHTSMLQQVIGSTARQESLIYSYKRSFSGFAAKLTEEEAQQMSEMDGVVSVFPSKHKMLKTTRSWDFLGFPQQVERRTIESNIIIGMIDSGIWPESHSFDDKGFGPPPTKWKGACQTSAKFTCNNKIIGAQYYRAEKIFGKEEIRSPRDVSGHGTHTASTAAGNFVSKASMMGYGLGTARGGVPSARIAVYKVCWKVKVNSCSDHDILAAFDDAIADGVDIISISIGGITPRNYFEDSIAIGSFHAVRKGIFISTAAGNEGPNPATISNFAPWFLSVAASTIDRTFFTEVKLGNDKTYQGLSINLFDLKNKMYPLVYGGDAPNTAAGFNGSSSGNCTGNSLSHNLVKGKIVLCDVPTIEPLNAGAVGSVMGGRPRQYHAVDLPFPASILDSKNAKSIIHTYVRATRNPTATILKSKERKDTSAPYITFTSSRGPNPISPTVLKPDLAAPGVHILAAWSPLSPVDSDKRVNYSYNIDTGTSMACPHATGAAAYVKSFHPTWSPAAIMSALITTAAPMSAEKNREAEFAYGAGIINPIMAPHPGLIYDINALDYIKFLCSEGYDTKLLQIITGDIHDHCSKVFNGTVFDLNYPTFALPTSPSKFIHHVFYRTVTNVGSPTSLYEAVVNSPHGLKIKVKPSVLLFTKLGQKLSFKLTIKGRIEEHRASASLIWSDGKFQVRSPLIVFVP